MKLILSEGMRFYIISNIHGIYINISIKCDYTFDPSYHHHWFEKGKGLKKNIDNYETFIF